MTAALSDELKDNVLSVVLHDDVISRLTPSSIRALLRELMVFRGNVFHNGTVFQHLHSDWNDIIQRAGTLWSPRWREVHPKGLGCVIVEEDETKDESFVVLSQETRFSLTENDDMKSISNDNDDGELVEQDSIIDLYLPGRIMHIYSHRGQYKAMIVDKSFPTLRRIEIQGNIFNDHRCENIYNALQELLAVRNAQSVCPPHQPFNASDVCNCCKNSFTWHATFRGKPQEYREKHNCKSCGLLVCGPCSMSKYPIAKYGLIFPVRLCDICVYNGEFAQLY